MLSHRQPNGCRRPRAGHLHAGAPRGRSVHSRDEPQGLAFRIPRNTFISRYRRQRHKPTIGGLDTVDPTAQGPAREEWLRDDLELERLRTVVGAEIERALMTLSEDARTVILLDLEGLTEIEVAQIVGCAVGTVKSRLARARAALRLLLKDYAR